MRTTCLTPPSPPPRSLRSIEQVNPGLLDSVKAVFEAGTAACHDLAFSLPARQLASSLLAVNSTFSSGRPSGARLQWASQTPECLASAAKGCANSGCRSRAPSQQHSQHHLPEREEPRRSAGVAGRGPEDRGLDLVPVRISDSFSESVAYSPSSVVGPYHLWLGTRW